MYISVGLLCVCTISATLLNSWSDLRGKQSCNGVAAQFAGRRFSLPLAN